MGRPFSVHRGGLACGRVCGVLPTKRRMAQPEVVSQLVEDMLKPGQVVSNRFLVTRKIKRGGFGEVYEARDKTTKVNVALKVEDAKLNPTLAHEVIVLNKMKGYRHVARLYESHAGTRDGGAINYIAMQLLGSNFSDLRKQCPNKKASRFSESTAARISVEWLESLMELHSIGYIHRDVKASNFAIGNTNRTKRMVFLIDFGMARLHVTDSGKVVTPRRKVQFRGTTRYASIASHLNQDLGRKDDLLSLLYTMIEAFTGELPWRNMHNDKEAVLRCKQTTTMENVCKNSPKELLQIGVYLEKLGYYDKPQYVWLIRQLKNVVARVRANPIDPYDWECEWSAFKEIANKKKERQATKP